MIYCLICKKEFKKISHNQKFCSNKCSVINRKKYNQEYDKNRYISDKEQILIKTKKYRDTHKTQLKKYHKNHYQKNRELIKKYWLKYRLNNKEQIKEQRRKHYLKNIQKILLKNKLWRLNNKQKINEYNSQKRLNINYIVAHRLRNRIRKVLQDNSKTASTIKLLDCSINYFKKYLESKFKLGMSWSNYGLYGWHIDHIKPCASFDLSKSEEQRKCFHYTNLQPLWAKENWTKGDK